MTRTVVGTFDNLDKIRNAKEDLVATGIPQEKIFVNEVANELKVIAPDVTEREILEILQRHDPLRVS
jgi:hypothetical protein